MLRKKIEARIEALLASYPRTRPPLTLAHEEVYEEEYKRNRDGQTATTSAAQKLEEWMHRKVASIKGSPTLEIGAGTLNHLRFESIADYDVVEPFTALYEARTESRRVRKFYDVLADVSLASRYSRIISIAVLEHLPDLAGDLARSALLLNKQGVFQAGIPSEGGFLWWLGWRCSTGLAYYLRTGLDYGVLMRHEHINDSPTIIALIRHFFEDVSVKRFPTPFHQLSFYAYVEARHPRREFAEAFLDHRATQ